MDYDALAQKYGGTSAAATPDYDKLAQQYGGTSAAAAPKPTGPSAADVALYSPTAGHSFLSNAVAAYGGALPNLIRGVGQRIGEAVGPTATAALGLPTQADVDEHRRLDAPLMATAGGKFGNFAGTVAPLLATAAIPAANTMLGAAAIGAGTGAIQPTGSNDSSRIQIPFTNIGMNVGSPVLANALAGAGLSAGGVGAGKLIGMGANKLMQASAADTAANAGKLGAIKSAQDAGYVLPPPDINPSPVNSVLGGISGKIKTQQAASIRNQPITNALVAKDLGLPADTTITPDVLQNIRNTAGQAYQAVRNTGTVNTSDAYKAALDAIGSKYQGANASFPGLANNDVPNMIDALNQPSFDAGHAIDAISILRNNADQAFRAGNNGFAKASKDAAGALEDELTSHLQATGQDPALVDNFKNARQQIAQTYSVQPALNTANGDISAKVLAQQLKKGKPLSPGMRTAAETATAFPESTQALTNDVGAVSPLDYLAGITRAHNTPMAVLNTLAVRPLLRNALLSDVGQRLVTPSTTPNALMQMLSADTNTGALVGQARRSTSQALNQDQRQP